MLAVKKMQFILSLYSSLVESGKEMANTLLGELNRVGPAHPAPRPLGFPAEVRLGDSAVLLAKGTFCPVSLAMTP